MDFSEFKFTLWLYHPSVPLQRTLWGGTVDANVGQQAPASGFGAGSFWARDPTPLRLSFLHYRRRTWAGLSSLDYGGDELRWRTYVTSRGALPFSLVLTLTPYRILSIKAQFKYHLPSELSPDSSLTSYIIHDGHLSCGQSPILPRSSSWQP